MFRVIYFNIMINRLRVVSEMFAEEIDAAFMLRVVFDADVKFYR